jgi:hypothetical protein
VDIPAKVTTLFLTKVTSVFEVPKGSVFLGGHGLNIV